MSDHIDKDKIYYDSMNIIQHVDGVITTDTSLLHIACNSNIPTYALLTLGADWRWGKDVHTKNVWYPTMTCLRQKELGDWKPIIEHLCYSI